MSQQIMLEDRTRLLLETTLAAMIVAEEMREVNQLHTVQKSDGSVVTAADAFLQLMLTKRLDQISPGMAVLGEENWGELKGHTQLLGTSSKFLNQFVPVKDDELHRLLSRRPVGESDYWICDPIDGTQRFISGNEYCTAVGRLHNGRLNLVLIGLTGAVTQMLGLPMSQPVILLSDGHQNVIVQANEDWSWKPIELLPRQEKRELVIAVRHRGAGEVRREAALAEAIGAQTLELAANIRHAAIALGLADATVSLPGVHKVWDHLGALLVQSIGGVVTDWYGKSLNFASGETLAGDAGIVAARDKVLHQHLLRSLPLSGRHAES